MARPWDALRRVGMVCAILGLSALLPGAMAMAQDGAIRCDFDPMSFGIIPVTTMPLSANADDAPQAYLRAKILRYEPPGQKSLLAVGAPPNERSYRDVLIVFHLPEEMMAAPLQAVEAALSTGETSRLIAIQDCNFKDEGQFTLYAPFATAGDEGQFNIAASVIVLTRAVGVTLTPQALVRLPPSEDAIATLLSGLGDEPAAAAPLPVEGTKPELPEPEPVAAVTWQRNFYPWIVDLDFATLEPGDEVFAADQVRCETGGNFIVGSTGSIALPEEREPASPEELPVRRQQMIAANIYFGASGKPLDQQAVAASVNETAYWCIPKRELCFQQIDFGDFSVRSRQGEIIQFNRNSIVSLRHGLDLALQRVVMDNCPQETVRGK